MMNIKCIIIDSDNKSRELIKNCLRNFEEFKIVGEAITAIEGIKLIERNKIDLMILDIDLPDLSGFELMNSLISAPKTIVTSVNSQYAIDCFDFNVIDYILKPVKAQGDLVSGCLR